MNKTKIKICGITNEEDALVAAKLGANFVGFIFYNKSPRSVSPEKVAKISQKLPAIVRKVGVFVNAEKEFIDSTIKTAELDFLQLHGDESPKFCEGFSVPVIKAFRIKNKIDLQKINDYSTEYVLLDAFQEGKFGGTGKEIDLSVLENVNSSGKKIFLSGGLTAENVCNAIKKVKPFAVDVASGVEAKPGEKDLKKMKKFIESIKCCSE